MSFIKNLIYTRGNDCMFSSFHMQNSGIRKLQYKKSWSVNPRTSRFSIQFSHFFLFYCMQLCARLCYPSCALWQLCKWFILENGYSPRLLQDLQKGKMWLAVNRSLFLLLHPFSCSPLEVWRSKRFHGRNPQTMCRELISSYLCSGSTMLP